jgi:2-hydroxychromene-2-carboxylate isomerase
MIALRRVADFLQLPFCWPQRDPAGQFRGEDGMPYTEEKQPYIHRLTMLGILAQEQDQSIEVADEIYRLIWSGNKNWHEGTKLQDAASRCKLDLASMDEHIQQESSRLEAAIQTNQKAHDAAGHWCVPTYGYKGQAYFGQDRLDVLLWALKKDGLNER